MYVKWTGDLLRKRWGGGRDKGHRSLHAYFFWFDGEDSSGNFFIFFVLAGNSCGTERELSVITSNYWPISRSIYL